MRTTIVVTHLLGAGHLRRAINLAQAFAQNNTNNDSDDAVTIISGGMPVSAFKTANTGFTFKQLPPLRSDGTNFQRLLMPDGEPADDEYFQTRKEMLADVMADSDCDVLITELFPFGRRVLREEFTHLLDETYAVPSGRRPVILSSVRDILAAPSSSKKQQQTEALIEHFYDGVLVHADRAIIKLEESWPVTEKIKRKLRYTGFVTQAKPQSKPINQTRSSPSVVQNNNAADEILVSAGSGSVGSYIYDAAIATASTTAGSQWRWRLLIGGSDPGAEIARLEKIDKGKNVTIEANRSDFLELLTNCHCSVSMCGYNTAVELLMTNTAGVLIPFDEDKETEQTIRAGCMGRMPNYNVVERNTLTPETLATAIAEVTDYKRNMDNKIDNGASENESRKSSPQINGAARTVAIARELYSVLTQTDPNKDI